MQITPPPTELADLPFWLVWRLVYVEGQSKPRKVPYYINGERRSGTQGTTEDLDQLVTFAQATEAVQQGGYSGIGLAILPQAGIVGLDFDDCVVDRKIDARVEALCDHSYTEFSPSGTGVHAFFKGKLVSHKDSSAIHGDFPVEVFGHNGFLTFTGDATEKCSLFGWDEQIVPLTPAVLQMYRGRGWDDADSVADAPTTHEEQLDAADRARLLATVTDDTMADVRSAVAALGSHRYGAHSYEGWWEIIVALKSLEDSGRGDEAWEIALEFSRRGGTAFGLSALEKKWRETTKKKTYKTIFLRATEDGWVNPKSQRPAPDRPDGGRVDRTDSGNVNALYEITDGNLRWILERKAWLWWDGSTWVVDEAGSHAGRSALLVGERYLVRAQEKENEAEGAVGDDRKRLQKLAESYRSWGATCRNRRGMDNMLALAKAQDRFAISVSQLDIDPWALGVANGVVDLRNGQMRDNCRDDFITKRSPYGYAPHARAEKWSQFIGEITATPQGKQFAHRGALASYLQRAIGYCATGSTKEHKMFVYVGDPAAGKSVLLDVLEKVLGPYCVQIPTDAMMASSRDVDSERPTPFARALAGARLAVGSEAKENHKLNAAWVKKNTGDARMTARGLHENAFTFDITHKLVLVTNHEPHFDQMDEATRERVHTVPFDCKWNRPGLPNPNPNLPQGDKHLKDKLFAEAEGVLAWIVAGAVAYHRDGLEPPPEVVKRTLAYFEEQDAFTKWLESMERCAAKAGTAARTLLDLFHAWCSTQGKAATPGTPQGFAKALKSKQVERTEVNTGTLYGLRPSDDSLSNAF